jgi:hypothetical protein
VDSRSRLREPAQTPNPHPSHPDTVRGGRESDRHRSSDARRHRRVSDAERLRAAGPVDHVHRRPRLHLRRARRGRLVGHPSGDEQRAVGDRGAHADEGGSAQHVLRAVAPHPRAADPVGTRHDRADDDVRTCRQPVHPEVAPGHQLSRHRRVGELLPVHRIRIAPGRRSGSRGWLSPRAGSRPG